MALYRTHTRAFVAALPPLSRVFRSSPAIPITCNVKSEDSLKAMVDEVVEKLGTIDILVNNAQEVPLGPLNDVSDETFTAGWESGPLATFRLMKLCHPHLKGGGSIINLGSTAAKRWDMANYGCYAAVKEAIRSLTQAAACEWAVDGIRTNVVLPHAKSPGLVGWIDSNPEEAEEFFSTIPMRRVGECEEDIGRFVAMLCSDSSAYVNGQSIAIDGGQVAFTCLFAVVFLFQAGTEQGQGLTTLGIRKRV